MSLSILAPVRAASGLIMLAFVLTQFVGFAESIVSPVAGDTYGLSYALEIWLPRLLYPLVAVVLLAQSGWHRIPVNLLSVSVAGLVLVAVLQVRAGAVTPAIFASAFFVVWIASWTPISPEADCRCLESRGVHALIIYLIAPIVVLCVLYLVNMLGGLPERYQFIIDRSSNNGLFRAESFRGFTRDRIAYSYLCGIAVLYLLAAHGLNRRSFTWMVLLLAGLALGASRAVLIALVLSVCAVSPWKRMAIYFVMSGLLVFAAAGFVSGRPDFFVDSGNRLDLLFGYWNYLLANQTVLLTGEGRFGTEIMFNGSWVRAHSWPVNSVMNFGVLTTLAWVSFLCVFFRKLQAASRAVVIYFVTVGLFHNGFDAYFFSMEQLLGFLVAILLSTRSMGAFPSVQVGGTRQLDLQRLT